MSCCKSPWRGRPQTAVCRRGLPVSLLMKWFLFVVQIEEELWEEEFIERCFQEMLEEEEEHEWFIPARDLPQTMDQIQDQFNDLVISDSSSLEDLVVNSVSRPVCKARCSLCPRPMFVADNGERKPFPRGLGAPKRCLSAAGGRWVVVGQGAFPRVVT